MRSLRPSRPSRSRRAARASRSRRAARPSRSRRAARAPRSHAVFLAAIAALAVAASGCGESNQPSSVEWRNVTMELPDGWYLFEEEETRLSISNQDIGISEVQGEPTERPEGDTVAMFFTYERSSIPDDWRDLLEDLDAEIETDRALRLAGDVPATQIVYRYETQGVITREMAVVIPSRSIVLFAQPVPAPGDDDVSDIFLEYLDDFMSVLESAEFGAPVQD